MNPIMPCPHCGKATDFHKDEVENVEDGIAVCLECGLQIARDVFILEVIAGEHPEFVDKMMNEED